MPSKILLVDDDTEFREELKTFLDDFEFIEASNGEDALKTLKRPNEIDLVLLDVRMPGMDGTEVLREMKSIAPELGIVILTAHSSEDTAIAALKGHADDYIAKPPNPKKIREVVENMLDSKLCKKGLSDNNLKDKIERVKIFVERNCHKKVCLNDAAAAVSLSPKYLSRIFRGMVGKGFSDYRLAVKTKEAKNLLKNTGLNVDQISDKLGYQNTESFIRAFKKIAALTPSSFRKKYR